MCLYPREIKNKRFLPTRKNNYKPPVCHDRRLLYIQIPCGKCYECRKQNAEAWRIRINEEYRSSKHAMFVTMTFSEQKLLHYEELCIQEFGFIDDNKVAKLAIRHFLENYRKHNKTSVKHWFITEQGHNGTERLHIHGIIFAQFNINDYWHNGITHTGWVNEKTIAYVVKYILKDDNSKFKGKIFCSPGLGKTYTEPWKCQRNKFIEHKTDLRYRYDNNHIGTLPKYYKNKIYNQEQRDSIFIDKYESRIRYVMGEAINLDKEQLYEKTLNYYRQKMQRIGLDNPQYWEIKENTRKDILKKQYNEYCKSGKYYKKWK